MSAALVESVREAIAARNAFDKATPANSDALFNALTDAEVALDLPAILAALTEAEALRAQITERAVNATIDYFNADTIDIPCLSTERGTGCLGRTQDEVSACMKRDREAVVQAIVDRVLGGS